MLQTAVAARGGDKAPPPVPAPAAGEGQGPGQGQGPGPGDGEREKLAEELASVRLDAARLQVRPYRGNI